MDHVEVVYFSEEMQEMSEQLKSMIAHLDAKTRGVQQHKTESSETLDELIRTATNVHTAWKEFRAKIELMVTAGDNDYKRGSASRLLEYSDHVPGNAPMVQGHLWRIYATDPILPIRLSLIVTSPIIHQVLGEMEERLSREHNWFYEATHSYVSAYEAHQIYLRENGA